MPLQLSLLKFRTSSEIKVGEGEAYRIHIVLLNFLNGQKYDDEDCAFQFNYYYYYCVALVGSITITKYTAKFIWLMKWFSQEHGFKHPPGIWLGALCSNRTQRQLGLGVARG